MKITKGITPDFDSYHVFLDGREWHGYLLEADEESGVIRFEYQDTAGHRVFCVPGTAQQVIFKVEALLSQSAPKSPLEMTTGELYAAAAATQAASVGLHPTIEAALLEAGFETHQGEKRGEVKIISSHDLAQLDGMIAEPKKPERKIKWTLFYLSAL